MICRKCKRRMKYDFQLPNEIWKNAWKKSKAIGLFSKKDGVLCAHCALNALGLNLWRIKKGNVNVKTKGLNRHI